MTHLFIEKNNSAELFVLFHGTGGNEFSLLFLTGALDPTVDVLSFTGNIGTGKERRFFNPLVDNQLDQPDFDKQIQRFLNEWDGLSLTYDTITFLGYSNGANFIQGILSQRPAIANKVVLLHPHNFDLEFTSSQVETQILITTGANDTLSLAGEVLNLKNKLQQQLTPHVQLHLTDGFHEVSDGEVQFVSQWYQQQR